MKITIRHLGLLVVCFAAAGCGTQVTTVQRPESFVFAQSQTAQPIGSMFSGDAEVLSDQAIVEILEYEYQPPPLSRIALMPFEQQVWSTWSGDFLLQSGQLKHFLIDRLRESPRVYDASILPTILIPEQRTVPHLREAATRYQADLLLAYRSSCYSFERYRVFGTDRSEGSCSVEGVLLDMRTGLVPMTWIGSENFSAEQNPEDLNFTETILTAQLEATGVALASVSEASVEFLGEEN
ncbi:MAG: hypothetical protein OXJ56_15170 [Rhodospirillaceae bacterium]|nr:hypothetical protein [Rhodospirillaceae bacterium]